MKTLKISLLSTIVICLLGIVSGVITEKNDVLPLWNLLWVLTSFALLVIFALIIAGLKGHIRTVWEGMKIWINQ